MWTQTDVDLLRQAIATGAVRVRYADGREVIYRSLAEMRSLLREIEAAVSNTPEERVTYAAHCRD